MSISDLEKVNARQLQNLKRKQFQEMNRLDSDHQSIKAEIKKNHNSDILDLQNENSKQIVAESEKKEKVLSQMKHHLDETQRMTDKEIKQLKEQSTKIKQQEFEKLSLEREKIKTDHEVQLQEMNYTFSNAHNKMASENQNNLSQLKESRLNEISNNEAHFEQRLSEQKNEFASRFSHDSGQNEKIKNDQDLQFKKNRMSTNLRQQIEMNKMTSSHRKSVEAHDTEFKKGLKDQGLQFETKYAQDLKAKNDDLKRLEDLNKKVEIKMKSDLKEKLEASITRSDDPFYRFTELRPTLKQYEDRIEVMVEVPDHSKSDLQFTLNNKEAIISFNRRYDDSRKDENAVNQLHKVESFTTRIATGQHLDPKSVKSKYADGVMTYTVKKA